MASGTEKNAITVFCEVIVTKAINRNNNYEVLHAVISKIIAGQMSSDSL